MAEIQLARIRSLYGDLKGLLNEIPLGTTSGIVSQFIVSQINKTIDSLSLLTDTDFSSYQIPDSERLINYKTHFPTNTVRAQLGRVISRLEEEYGFNGHSSSQIPILSKTTDSGKMDEVSKKSEPDSLYIKESIVELIKSKQDGFNYKKLLGLVKELNKNYLSGNSFSCLSLIRAITDHIPPLLGYDTFEEVVNNYKWSKTDKQYIVKLFDDRPVSDDSLHRTISTSDDLIDMTNIPNNQFLNRLLQECLEKTVQPGVKHKEDVKPKDEARTKKVTNLELRPIVRAELLSTMSGPDGYSINFLIRNVGKGLALLKELSLGDAIIQVSSISLAENEKYETTINLTNFKLRKGEIENPEVIINYDNIDSNKFQTSYKINLTLRADGLYNLQSFTDPKFSQVS